MSEPSEAPLPWPPDHEELVPFLPMVYVAWADGILSPEEMDRIRRQIRDEKPLSPAACRILESWLDPQSPPSAGALARMRERIREVGKRVPPEEARSLAALGAALAPARDDGEEWGTEGGLRTLKALEEVLGVLGGEAARALLAPAHPRSPSRERAPAPWATDLRKALEDEHQELRGRIFELLTDPRIRVPDGLPAEEHRKRVLQAVELLAQEEMGLLAYPKEVGGRGDLTASIAAFETLAYGNLSVLVKYGVQFGLFGGSILQLGTQRHHREYLAAAGRLELPGVFAMTERERGSDVRDLQTRARYLAETEEFEIHTPHPGAVKDWLGNAALHGRMAVVFAQLEVGGQEHGVHAILVPIRDDRGSPLPGVEIQDCGVKVGLNGVDNGRIAFRRVRVPRENLLDRFAQVTTEGRYRSPIASPGRRFFTMLGTLVGGRISVAAASVSVAKTALAIAVRYSDERRQFGPAGEAPVPILDYLTQQRALLPRLAATYALHFSTRRLIRHYAACDDEESRHRMEVGAAGLKAYASRHAVDTVQTSREAMGGRGYLAENRMGYLREDVDVFTTFEGTNVVLLLLTARGLLSRYRDELGELRFWDTVKFLAERAGTEVSRRNPVRSRRTGEEHLQSADVQLDAFRFREERLLETAARRLKSRIDGGMDSFEAMNETQDHLTALATAHVERMILEDFENGIRQVRDEKGEEPARTLASLRDLYALSRLEADRAWFLESGYMEARQSRAIRGLVNQLCREVRLRAASLVDAFGIPDPVLAAPAAFHVTEEE